MKSKILRLFLLVIGIICFLIPITLSTTISSVKNIIPEDNMPVAFFEKSPFQSFLDYVSNFESISYFAIPIGILFLISFFYLKKIDKK